MSELAEQSKWKSAEQQTSEIADRFFSVIDDIFATSEGPVHLAYFVASNSTHEEVRTSLLDGVEYLLGHPDSKASVGGNRSTANFYERVILTSMVSENQLVEKTRISDGVVVGREYWITQEQQKLPDYKPTTHPVDGLAPTGTEPERIELGQGKEEGEIDWWHIGRHPHIAASLFMLASEEITPTPFADDETFRRLMSPQ